MVTFLISILFGRAFNTKPCLMLKINLFIGLFLALNTWELRTELRESVLSLF